MHFCYFYVLPLHQLFFKGIWRSFCLYIYIIFECNFSQWPRGWVLINHVEAKEAPTYLNVTPTDEDTIYIHESPRTKRPNTQKWNCKRNHLKLFFLQHSLITTDTRVTKPFIWKSSHYSSWKWLVRASNLFL